MRSAAGASALWVSRAGALRVKPLFIRLGIYFNCTVAFDDGIAVQNVPPITSWPNEGIFEPNIALSTFFQCDDLSSDLIYKEFNYCSFILLVI
jgi:hypothetical protein